MVRPPRPDADTAACSALALWCAARLRDAVARVIDLERRR
jgi:hypothetical protein